MYAVLYYFRMSKESRKSNAGFELCIENYILNEDYVYQLYDFCFQVFKRFFNKSYHLTNVGPSQIIFPDYEEEEIWEIAK